MSIASVHVEKENILNSYYILPATFKCGLCSSVFHTYCEYNEAHQSIKTSPFLMDNSPPLYPCAYYRFIVEINETNLKINVVFTA